MFAAWEAGVWNVLHKRVRPDMIVGASAGAWNGWLLAGGGTPEDLVREWLAPEKRQLLRPGLHRAGILRPDALHRKAHELAERFHPRIPFGLTMVEVPGMRVRLVRGEEITWRHLAATCSVPFCFPPVRIEGRYYVDGGLLGALPLWAAEEMGARRAIAFKAWTVGPFRLLHRVAGRRPSAALEVNRIEPSQPLGSVVSSMRWSEANIRRWIEMGERDSGSARFAARLGVQSNRRRDLCLLRIGCAVFSIPFTPNTLSALIPMRSRPARSP
jgi:NTE family protein